MCEKKRMLELSADKLCWINGSPDDPEDLCAHGHAAARIGDEVFEYEAAVSAGALYLLKSLTEDHVIYKEEQFFPCCGFAVLARDEKLDTVDIIGCPNGVDWSVFHEGEQVRLVTSTGKETVVPLAEYRETVYAFADKVEDFYRSCSPKVMPSGPLDRDGYTAFWNEWHRRRHP